MRDDVDEFVELAVLLRQLVVGRSQALILLVQLGLQPAPGRHILGHESGVADRVLRNPDTTVPTIQTSITSPLDLTQQVSFSTDPCSRNSWNRA